MELYERVSYTLSQNLTKAYSTSFSQSIKLFPSEMQRHISAIYGLVRIADEIVDTYKGSDSSALLDELEKHTYQAIKTSYSTNPIVHAFAVTAKLFHIDRTLLHPFFESMRMDLTSKVFTEKLYSEYIHGSAEVVGLMCLKVFVANEKQYNELEEGAKHLGAAYQKVNFLRDIKDDSVELKRWYFPYGTFETFDEALKQRIVENINNDIALATPAAAKLPKTVRPAVELSIRYYQLLLDKIAITPAEKLKKERIRISDAKKMSLLIRAKVKR